MYENEKFCFLVFMVQIILGNLGVERFTFYIFADAIQFIRIGGNRRFLSRLGVTTICFFVAQAEIFIMCSITLLVTLVIVISFGQMW